MNNVIFQNQKIWRKDYEGQNGTFSVYNISISKKKQDDSWVNAYLKIKFSQSAEAPEKISNGTVADLEGFLTVDSYKGKNGKDVSQLMLMVTKLNIAEEFASVDDIETDNFTQAAEDIPFN